MTMLTTARGGTMRTSNVYRTVASLVDSGWLPAPGSVHAEDGRVDLHLRAPAEVDLWVRHLQLPPAAAYRAPNCYASTDFAPIGSTGWCGCRVLTVTCPLPAEGVSA